jgi:hypothetical protein
VFAGLLTSGRHPTFSHVIDPAVLRHGKAAPGFQGPNQTSGVRTGEFSWHSGKLQGRNYLIWLMGARILFDKEATSTLLRPIRNQCGFLLLQHSANAGAVCPANELNESARNLRLSGTVSSAGSAISHPIVIRSRFLVTYSVLRILQSLPTHTGAYFGRHTWLCPRARRCRRETMTLAACRRAKPGRDSLCGP